MSRKKGRILVSAKVTTTIRFGDYKGSIVGYIPSDSDKRTTPMTPSQLSELIAAAQTQPDENGKKVR